MHSTPSSFNEFNFFGGRQKAKAEIENHLYNITWTIPNFYASLRYAILDYIMLSSVVILK